MGARLAGTQTAAVVTHQRTPLIFIFPSYPTNCACPIWCYTTLNQWVLYWTDNNFGFWNVSAPLCSSRLFLPPLSHTFNILDPQFSAFIRVLKRDSFCVFFLLPQLGDKPPPPPLGLHCLASLSKSDENVMKSNPLPPSYWCNNWSRGFTYKCKIAQNYLDLKKY